MISISNLSQLFYKLAKNNFSYDILNSLETLKEKDEYLSKFFTVLDKGTKRKIFLKSSKQVIKLTLDINNIEENKIEAIILSANQFSFLPKFYRSASDYSWIEVELVRPLNNEDEIEKLIGVLGYDFQNIMFNLYLNKNITIYDYILSQIQKYKNENNINEIKNWRNYLTNPYLKELDKFISKFNLDTMELTFIFNLGKSASGNLVLLDVGKVL